MRRIPQEAVALTALLLLGSCSSSGPQAAAARPQACPEVAIVGDVSQVTKFREGSGRAPADMLLQVRVADFDNACTADTRQNRIDVALTVQFEAQQGPANRDRKGAYDYFVAIADKTNYVLAKKVFSGQIDFPVNQTRVLAVEELTQSIPLRGGEGPTDYKILVGFQLTPAELQYNRERGRR